MHSKNVREKLNEMLDEQVDDLVSAYIPLNSYPEQWQSDTLQHEVQRIFGITIPIKDWATEEGVADEEIFNRIVALLDENLKSRDAKFGEANMQQMEKRMLLFTLDEVWKDHLHFLDNLRHGINLRAYAQKDPLNEYKQECFSAFGEMIKILNEKYLNRLFNIQIHENENISEEISELARNKRMHETNQDPALVGIRSQLNPGLRADPKVTIRTHVKASDRVAADPSTWGKVARNEPCPCGSGKKFKACHGMV